MKEAIGRIAEEIEDKMEQNRSKNGLPPLDEHVKKEFADLKQWAYEGDLRAELRKARNERDDARRTLMRVENVAFEMETALRFYACESWDDTVQKDRGDIAREALEHMECLQRGFK